MRTPEQQARETIDALLGAAGWATQDIASLNLHAARGVAVREMQSHGGPADYILFVDGKALGIVEAKKEGTTLSAVAEQSARYTHAHNWIPQRWADPLPFTYESTGVETNRPRQNPHELDHPRPPHRRSPENSARALPRTRRNPLPAMARPARRALLGELLGGWPGAFLAQRGLRHKCSKPGYQMVFRGIVLLYQIVAVDVILEQALSRAMMRFLDR